jgi:NTE family protein
LLRNPPPEVEARSIGGVAGSSAATSARRYWSNDLYAFAHAAGTIEMMRPVTRIAPTEGTDRPRSSPATRRRRSARRPRRPRTAFVLSGGASLSALQVGMLRALYELGIAPDVLVATSAGALNAAFVASRPQTVATTRELARIWQGLQRDDVFPVSPWKLLGGLLGKSDHLVPAEALRKLVGQYLRFDDLADAPIPLHVLACDVDRGCEALLSEGPALDAIAAAAAIPGVLPPVHFGDRRLIDGGVLNNTPISHAVQLRAERIYVLPTQQPSPVPGRTARGALSAAIGGIGLLVGSRLEADIARYAGEAELIVLPAPNPLQVQPTDFAHASRLIRDALAAARRRLAQPPEPASLDSRLRATG